MRVQLTFSAEFPDDVDADEIRDKIAGKLADAGGNVVDRIVSVRDTGRLYSVVGLIKGKPTERWEATVRAQDSNEAETKAAALEDERGERVTAGTFEEPSSGPG